MNYTDVEVVWETQTDFKSAYPLMLQSEWKIRPNYLGLFLINSIPVDVSLLFRWSLYWLFLFLSLVSGAAASDCMLGQKLPNQLRTYPAPAGALLNDDFRVRVRISEGEWQNLDTYLVKVDELRGAKHNVENSSMAFFDFSGRVEVEVSYLKEDVNTACVRPLAWNITPKVNGNTLHFSLKEPANLSVEVNGDIFHNLHLFANPMLSNIPDPEDPTVIYFGPGIHDFPEQQIRVPANKTVYIDGSAILRGQLLIHDVSNVNVVGRGMIEHTVKMGVHIANARNVYIEGIFTTQCATGGSQGVTIRNLKSISYFGWGDGLNVFASNDVHFDRVFCRNSDDCTTVYATRKGFTGGCRNIVMENSTLWADVAHPIMIGIHGNSTHPDTIQQLIYRNIDILDHKEMQLDYQGCMTINSGDNNVIKDVLFEDIRVEDFREGQLVNLRIFYNEKYCTAPGGSIEDIHFRNVNYQGTRANVSIIAGYNENRRVRSVTFENLKINGTLIHDEMEGKPPWYKTADMARIFIGEHVENIIFKITP